MKDGFEETIEDSCKAMAEGVVPVEKAALARFSLPAKAIAEFVGVTLFVFFGTSQWSPDHNVVIAALSHGLTIFILITSLGHISGGHFNPVVTLAVALLGKIRPIDALCYVLAQLAAGFFGAMLTRFILTKVDYLKISGGVTVLDMNYDLYKGVVAEALATFLLVHTVLLAAVDDTKWHAALAIGMAIAVDILSIGHITGASMNPARSFGPNLVLQIFGAPSSTLWEYHFIYWLGPVIGCLLAVGLFRMVYSREWRLLL